MSEERLDRLEKTVSEVLTAIKGNDLGADGVIQHVRKINTRLDSMDNKMEKRFSTLENDVKELKNDKRTIKGWIAGLSAAGGLGGVIGHWFGK